MPTLVHHIRAQASADPARPALFGPVRDGWRQLGWGVWWASVRQAAGGLLVGPELGLSPGDPVLLWSGAQPEWAVIWPALCLAGVEPVLLDPSADERELLLAVADRRVRVAAVSGRDRLERVLRLREEGVLPLESVITLDRTPLEAPRLVDLEKLIERGGPHRLAVLERLEALGPGDLAARLPDGQVLHHRDLVQPEASAGTSGRLVLAASPARAPVLGAIGQTVAEGGELWFAGLVDDVASELPRIRPDALLLDGAGWRAVERHLEHLADDTEGVQGQLVRLSVQSAPSSGPVGAVARSVLGPLLRAAGLLGTRSWADPGLEPALADRLGQLGVVVEPAPDPLEPFSLTPGPASLDLPQR